MDICVKNEEKVIGKQAYFPKKVFHLKSLINEFFYVYEYFVLAISKANTEKVQI